MVVEQVPNPNETNPVIAGGIESGRPFNPEQTEQVTADSELQTAKEQIGAVKETKLAEAGGDQAVIDASVKPALDEVRQGKIPEGQPEALDGKKLAALLNNTKDKPDLNAFDLTKFVNQHRNKSAEAPENN